MRIWIALLALLLFPVGLVQALELVANGDFEAPLDPPWQQSVLGAGGIDRSANHQPDPDYEARAWHGTGNGHSRLYQVIPVPSVDLAFSVNARIRATATSTAWAAAGVVIAYLDQYDIPLGETAICRRSIHCPWANSESMHIIEAQDYIWETHAFNLSEELDNLPTIDPSAVKKIQISLLTVTFDC
jgi:hypothetical protein